MACDALGLLDSFASLPDPRMQSTQLHKLIDILAIAILGAICGADNWVDMAEFGLVKGRWLRRFLELPNGIPPHDTFGRVFARVDPEQFGLCFAAWVKTIGTLAKGQVIAIDGKTVRRSHDRTAGREAIHMVSAWTDRDSPLLGDLRARPYALCPEPSLLVWPA